MPKLRQTQTSGIELKPIGMSAGSSSPDEAGGGSEMAAGIMNIVGPSVTLLDSQVTSTKQAQALLAEKIQDLAELMHTIGDDAPYDLDEYVRKIDNSQRRLDRTGASLEKIHDRLSKLQRDIAREIHSKKQTTTAPTPAPPKR